jgi:hypothetical protein
MERGLPGTGYVKKKTKTGNTAETENVSTIKPYKWT